MASSLYFLNFERSILMANDLSDVRISQTRGYWEVYVNGEFFCTADSYIEALNELYDIYK